VTLSLGSMRRQVKTAACAPGANSSGKGVSSNAWACGVTEYIILDISASFRASN
jgi:hypothetical protein